MQCQVTRKAILNSQAQIGAARESGTTLCVIFRHTPRRHGVSLRDELAREEDLVGVAIGND